MLFNLKDVSKFSCFNKGWLFDYIYPSSNCIRSEFIMWNKGKTIVDNKTGNILDPIFGCVKYKDSWLFDNNFINWYIKHFNLDFKYKAETLCFNRDEYLHSNKYLFLYKFLVKNDVCKGLSLCGIKDNLIDYLYTYTRFDDDIKTGKYTLIEL